MLRCRVPRPAIAGWCLCTWFVVGWIGADASAGRPDSRHHHDHDHRTYRREAQGGIELPRSRRCGAAAATAGACSRVSAPQEAAIDTLAPVSVITLNTINTVSAKRLSDIFYNVPGVSFTDRGDSPANSINIRGLQDFGRVAVVVDGARQNYQVTGHNANGAFFLDPELVGGVEIVRGPTANVYGSGAIGGLVAFRTKDADDILKPGERFATDSQRHGRFEFRPRLGNGLHRWQAEPEYRLYLSAAPIAPRATTEVATTLLISNTANRVGTGLAKVTVRPLDGHEFKFGGLFQENNYNAGQYNRGPITTPALEAIESGHFGFRHSE